MKIDINSTHNIIQILIIEINYMDFIDLWILIGLIGYFQFLFDQTACLSGWLHP